MSTPYRPAERRLAAFALAAMLTLLTFAGIDRLATGEPPAALSAMMACAPKA
ncbi:MAG: hypothetical protein U1F50_13025 [Rubrivivax sp.]